MLKEELEAQGKVLAARAECKSGKKFVLEGIRVASNPEVYQKIKAIENAAAAKKKLKIPGSVEAGLERYECLWRSLKVSWKMRKKVKNLKNMVVESEGVKCNRLLIDENFVLHFATCCVSPLTTLLQL